MKRVIRAVLVGGLMVGSLAACGDDDDETAQTTTTVDQAAQRVQQYCEKSLALETVPEPDIDFEALSPAQQQEQAKKFANERFLPLVNEIEPLVPPEIQADGRVLIAKAREVGQTGNFDVFDQPDAKAAEQRVHAYDLRNCGWNRQDVTATEYAFQGLPQTLPAGPTSFELVNRGKEAHELVVMRINDDVKEPFAQVLRLPEEQSRAKVRPMGQTEAEPGQGDYAVARLEPGRYGVACFIPVGGRESGPPHTARGMFAEFTVS